MQKLSILVILLASLFVQTASAAGCDWFVNGGLCNKVYVTNTWDYEIGVCSYNNDDTYNSICANKVTLQIGDANEEITCGGVDGDGCKIAVSGADPVITGPWANGTYLNCDGYSCTD